MFKRIIEFFKNLFRKEKPKEEAKVTSKPKVRGETQYLPNAQIVRLLKYGDLIWCDIDVINGRPVREGHNKRAFLVLKITEDKIIGLHTTHYEEELNNRIPIPDKLGLVLVDAGYDELEYYQFISKGTKQMDKVGLEYLSNELYNSEVYMPNDIKEIVLSKTALKEGDIVECEDRYYLIAKIIDKLECTAYTLSKKQIKGYSINLDNHYYLSDGFLKEKIKRNKVKIVGRLGIDILTKIKIRKSKMRKSK